VTRLGQPSRRRKLSAASRVRPLSSWLAALGVVCALFASTARPVSAQTPTVATPNIVTGQPPNILNPSPQEQKQSSFGKQKSPFSAPKKIDKAAPLLLEGDELVYDTRNNRVIARGNVQIYYDDYILTADEVIYDQAANTLTATGNAQLKEPNGNIVRAEYLVTTNDFRDAFVQSLSLVGKDDSRIAARRAVRKDGNISEFEQAKFTPCKNDPGKPPLWCVSGARVVHDQQAGVISYQDAQFELFGVPVLYMPYFSHADPSIKRQSGFLIPEIGHNSTLGSSIHIPYYFALSPHYDFLFHPKYMTEHGVLWQGDWRQKLAIGTVRGEYTVKLAGIDQDSATLSKDLSPEKRRALDGWRGSVQTQGLFSLSSWWRFGWDITLESDDTFRRFYQLDNILQTDRVNSVFLEGLSDRNFFGVKFYHFGGLLLEDTSLSESRVHPVIDYNYVFAQPVLGGELSFNANAISMSRNNGTDIARASLDVNWRRKLVDVLGQVWTPFAYAKGDVTQFTNAFNIESGLFDLEGGGTRGVAAAGVTYAFPFVAHTPHTSHVLEPVAQAIVRTDSGDFVRVPNEDARSLVFDDTLLFDKDKFSGYDRLETGTRVNAGLQYTVQSSSGSYARFVAGQSVHVGGENPFASPGFTKDLKTNALVANFSDRSGLDSDRSDYVLGAYLAPTQAFKLVAQSRFDDEEISLRRANVYSSLALGPALLQGQYSYTRDDPLLQLYHSEHELLAAATLRLTDRWAVTGLVRYDIDQTYLLQEQVALKYSDECFVLTATYTENHINNPSLDIKPDRSLMLRFELKYLGDFKYRTDQLDHLFGVNQPTIR